LYIKLALAVFIWRRLVLEPGDAARPQAEVVRPFKSAR